MAKRKFWAGFVDDEPDVERIYDTYCMGMEHVETVSIYCTKQAARKRYQDFRRVTVEWADE